MQKKEKLLRLLPPLAMVLIIAFFGATLRKVSLADIVSLAPDNYFLCFLLVLGLYALKSLSVVFPLLVLYISVGALFPLPLALLVNILGLFVCVTLPFLIGRFSGQEVVGRLIAKYPKAGRLTEYSTENAAFLSYLLRVINLLPGDLVSMALGAANTPFLQYAAGSLLGLLPVMIPSVLLGQNLDNPFSPQFLISFAAIAVVSLLSTVLFNRWQKKKRHGTGQK